MILRLLVQYNDVACTAGGDAFPDPDVGDFPGLNVSSHRLRIRRNTDAVVRGDAVPFTVSDLLGVEDSNQVVGKLTAVRIRIHDPADHDISHAVGTVWPHRLFDESIPRDIAGDQGDHQDEADDKPSTEPSSRSMDWYRCQTYSC